VAVTDERSAALLVRVWWEDGTNEFRARVVSVGLSAHEEDRTIAIAASPRQVLDAVRDWLDERADTDS
jgi:hypothetical protein